MDSRVVPQRFQYNFNSSGFVAISSQDGLPSQDSTFDKIRSLETANYNSSLSHIPWKVLRTSKSLWTLCWCLVSQGFLASGSPLWALLIVINSSSSSSSNLCSWVSLSPWVGNICRHYTVTGTHSSGQGIGIAMLVARPMHNFPIARSKSLYPSGYLSSRVFYVFKPPKGTMISPNDDFSANQIVLVVTHEINTQTSCTDSGCPHEAIFAIMSGSVIKRGSLLHFIRNL